MEATVKTPTLGTRRGGRPIADPTELAPRNGIQRELETFHPSSYGWALACCDWDREAAEEVLQTAYLKAIEGRARFNGHSSARTWFFGVVKKTAAEQRRHRTVRGLALARWLRQLPVPEPAPTPESLSTEAEAQRRLRDLLGRLSSRQRELLHLVFYQQLTVEEAAGVLGISVGSARTHYERGKARLRRMLGGPGVSE
jgi:RNA polymerase sigma-70 factor (ECF subfamily)